MARLRTTILAMAMKALLLLAVLSLLPCAAIADVEASMPALLAHIREIQQLTKAAHGEVEEPDLDGWLGVAKAVDPEDVLQKTDATSQLFAHIYEVQQKAAEKLERLNGEVETETETEMEMELEMERIVKDEKEEEEEVDSGGVVDALVQARFNQLEATLKLLNDKDATESMQWSADGDDSTSLLHQFVQERQLKNRHLDGAGQGSQLEKDQRHEAIVEHGEIGHRDNHGDRDHARGPRDHENAHANADLSGLSDALYHKDDHSDHSHGQQHEESFKNMNFIPPEEEEEVDVGGLMDSLVQERFNQLEAALRFLNDKDGGDSMQWNADADVADDPINLLDQFVQERQQKKRQESQLEDEQIHEANTVDHGDIGHGHRNNHGNCEHVHGHQRDHGDANANAGANYRNHDHQHGDSYKRKKFVSLEEIAEEEDLFLYGFEGQEYPSAEYLRRSRGPELGVWLRSMGCSLLVSLASLICLMILPCIVSNGKPSETVVNALASFWGVIRGLALNFAIIKAGLMLGDAFLQLSHAFGNSESSYSKDEHQHHNDNGHAQAHRHDHISSAGQGRAHSLQDLSVVLAVLGGILLFFIVEKIIRRYEELSSHGGQRARGHNHHHRKKKNRAKKSESPEKIAASEELGALEFKESNSLETKSSDLRKEKRKEQRHSSKQRHIKSSCAVNGGKWGFVIGYLNLFSDAVHNFTDGMALGSAFLLHGTVGGWSRTLFLLAHELPQEVGDFGILVKSGFSVFEALAFNFLSALVALAGTAVALLLGGSLRHSPLIEAIIAGGFIYISVGGVMPSMHNQGSSLTSTISQFMSMVLGMGVAIGISLAE